MIFRPGCSGRRAPLIVVALRLLTCCRPSPKSGLKTGCSVSGAHGESKKKMHWPIFHFFGLHCGPNGCRGPVRPLWLLSGQIEMSRCWDGLPCYAAERVMQCPVVPKGLSAVWAVNRWRGQYGTFGCRRHGGRTCEPLPSRPFADASACCFWPRLRSGASERRGHQPVGGQAQNRLRSP